MECKKGCAACCIAISISSPLPGMPNGKKAGQRCVNLDEHNCCTIHNQKNYPAVCRALQPEPEMCGHCREDAFAYLEELERLTAPKIN